MLACLVALLFPLTAQQSTRTYMLQTVVDRNYELSNNRHVLMHHGSPPKSRTFIRTKLSVETAYMLIGLLLDMQSNMVWEKEREGAWTALLLHTIIVDALCSLYVLIVSFTGRSLVHPALHCVSRTHVVEHWRSAAVLPLRLAVFILDTAVSSGLQERRPQRNGRCWFHQTVLIRNEQPRNSAFRGPQVVRGAREGRGNHTRTRLDGSCWWDETKPVREMGPQCLFPRPTRQLDEFVSFAGPYHRPVNLPAHPLFFFGKDAVIFFRREEKREEAIAPEFCWRNVLELWESIAL
jgi:hypothetical protein